MKDNIKCQDCGKVIGTYDIVTDETIEIYDDYNTCDECGKEICTNCTVNIEEDDLNGCKECLENIPSYLQLVNIVKDGKENILYIRDTKNNDETDGYVEYYSSEQARNVYGDKIIDKLIKEFVKE